jgi:hypothetical protein
MSKVQDYVLGIVRHFLTTAAGGLIAHGYLNADQSQAIVGGIVALIGVAWSLLQKYEQRKKLAVAQNGH